MLLSYSTFKSEVVTNSKVAHCNAHNFTNRVLKSQVFRKVKLTYEYNEKRRRNKENCISA